MASRPEQQSAVHFSQGAPGTVVLAGDFPANVFSISPTFYSIRLSRIFWLFHGLLVYHGTFFLVNEYDLVVIACARPHLSQTTGLFRASIVAINNNEKD